MTESGADARGVRMTRRIVVEIHATADEADFARLALEQVVGRLSARATYHHKHGAPCCIQAPHSALGTDPSHEQEPVR